MENRKGFNPGIWPWTETFPAGPAEPTLASLARGAGAAQDRMVSYPAPDSGAPGVVVTN
jgi:hypothetical protein